ncbi:uncharacterized protein LOC119078895 [Bradysia coprophila]|uniref:uncharacterized protein LOC119078895 n=1 Tax=Bradysia coprophila TaxID=38358 RepID=UPI00187DD5A9|nr:uncharacterized protein LOC119078895 [Bradysia coprophila]
MSLKILLIVGLFIPSITAAKYTNESLKLIDDVYDHCREVVKVFPISTTHITRNMMESFKVYAFRLGHIAIYENSTLLSSSADMLLHTLALLDPLKDTPSNMLVQFEKVLPKMSAQLRQIVSSQQCSIGRLTDYINNDIKCVERWVQRLLNDFLRNGVGNLALGKKTDFEPVMKCLQKLTNKIAQISETALNDVSLSTESVNESVLILAIILTHCYVFVQGTKSTIAAIVHSESKHIPSTLNSCLDSVDASIVHLTKTIRSVNEICTVTLRTLLENLVSFNDFLNATLKSVFGLTAGTILTVHKVTEGLSSGVSSIMQGLTFSKC